jgi:hypothetical protein
MAPLALALHLVAAAPAGLAPPPAPAGAPSLAPSLAPPLAPRLDPGPFASGELALASAGAIGGDVLVLGSGYLALRLFANGTFAPTAGNFRRAAYAFGAAALLVPPLAAAGLARAGARGPLAGTFWRALLLGTVAQAAALAAGYYGAPHLWLVLPVQLVGVSLGTSYGLHWGSRRAPAARAPAPEPREASRDGRAASAAPFLPICPDA